MLSLVMPVISMDTDSEELGPGFTGGATDSQWSECLRRIALSQDKAAFRQLYDHFAPLIKSYACQVPGLEQAEVFAEELVQETMIKVWTKALCFDPRLASSGTWIFTIARNTRIDMLRKSARHIVNAVSLHADEEGDEGTLEFEDIWFEDELSDVLSIVSLQRSAQLLRESLENLPQDQAEILRKVYMEDKSHMKVAEELRLPLGTVKSRVRLALQKLKLAIS